MPAGHLSKDGGGRPALRNGGDKAGRRIARRFHAGDRDTVGQAHDAETIRPQRGNARIGADLLQFDLARQASGAAFAESAGMDHQRLGAMGNGFLDRRQDLLVRQIDRHHIGRMRQGIEALPGLVVENGVAAGIDQEYLAGIAELRIGLQEADREADAAGPAARPDQCDGARIGQRLPGFG